MIGRTLGPYEVVAKLGEGGMGEVYRARDTKLGRDVAIKVLPEAFAADPDRLARFEREARTLAALNHPNIAQIHDMTSAAVSSRDGRESTPEVVVSALVMELVEGEDLAARIARGPVPVAEAMAIARQIADALDAAHEQGIIHRDLKPANIKVRADGTVKVLDFGLAKALDPAGPASGRAALANSPTLTARATEMGTILGTAAYMAPEQARGRTVDRRADVWAFGVVLFELLTGRRAFEGDDLSITLANVLKEDVPWEALPADVPPSVRRLLRRCLDKDPRRRLSAIADARLDLDDADRTESAGTASVPARRGGRAPLAAAALVTAIVAGALWWTVGRSDAPAVPVRRLSILPPQEVRLYPDLAESEISPDGRWIAMVTGDVTAVGSSQLWLRAADGIDPRRVEGGEGAHMPFFSPDSRRLAFFAEGKLKTVPVEGGRPTVVCDAPNARGGAWGAREVSSSRPPPQARSFRCRPAAARHRP